MVIISQFDQASTHNLDDNVSSKMQTIHASLLLYPFQSVYIPTWMEVIAKIATVGYMTRLCTSRNTSPHFGDFAYHFTCNNVSQDGRAGVQDISTCSCSACNFACARASGVPSI